MSPSPWPSACSSSPTTRSKRRMRATRFGGSPTCSRKPATRWRLLQPISSASARHGDPAGRSRAAAASAHAMLGDGAARLAQARGEHLVEQR